ncbi:MULTISPECIES: invasion protein CiaB [unclassified Campylobacter]|uniref:invasion protein CiaB n=1 Tax=unclassified Campylobacter TaxID=2593542 RepID=UPI001BDB424D|nr:MULTISPECIES: invasion protein CiaB [unclassified Campylobacter]MBT0880975.1 invasion protein CiaB [Campylobacter sp. 2018MI27]MBT0883823.1 invasion protein CiaB [Campylobacter sp. 2018MI10]
MLGKIIKEHEEELFSLYKLNSSSNHDLARLINNDLKELGLEINDMNFNSYLLRIIELNTTNYENTCKKNNINLAKAKDLAYKRVKEFYEQRHIKIIEKLSPCLDRFYVDLLNLVHKIGLVFNSIQPKWDKAIEKNNEFFKSLENPYEFIKNNKLYYLDENDEIATRIYAIAINLDTKPELLPYSLYFEEEFKKIDEYFNEFFKLNHKNEAYIKYLKALQNALMSKELSLKPWQNAEIAWMGAKDFIQVGHFLEYYEDAFTHSVALEWDIRIDDNYDFNSESFVNKMKNSLNKAYKNANITNQNALNLSLANLDKIELHISKPILYYGAELNGLFSAQVVPNDEFVSANYGKKIFAFLDFVYKKTKSKPRTMLNQKVFDKAFNDYNKSVLNDEFLWKKIYEISTIGHEAGHIFFIGSDTESLMNTNGVFKNIEEFKASAGGIYDFCNHFDEKYKKALLANITSRAVSLMAYKSTKEIEPYYCEGLIFLAILFKSKVLSFSNDTLLSVDLEKFEDFQKEFLNVYNELAKTYLKKENANNFLKDYAVLKDLEYISTNKDLVKLGDEYRKLYDEFANVLIKENE